ncbi:MAG TPA: AI-2E family transporter [Terriglobia bacterium]|nr:AI-2E family transporter [Terriglobia bacterium]
MPESKLEIPASASSASLRIIAVGIVIFALYYASSIIIVLVCSILIAFVLDPGVRGLERLRLPRWLGSLLMVLLGLAGVYLLIYVTYDRAVELTAELPKLAARLEQLTSRFEAAFRSLRPAAGAPAESIPTVRLQQESPWVDFLLRGIGSAYSATVTVMFIPFLVFFMLASRNQVWAATLNLFPVERRQQAEDVIASMTAMVRHYVLGNVLVALISAAIITPVFAWIGLPYALLFGPLSAFLSMIPYLGVALAMLPPLLMALIQFDHVGPFLTIAVTVTAVHLVAINVLTPKLVGHRVKLNPLSVTLAMMFWGWLWGGVGLVLAVPVTAALKAVCDNIRSLRPIGAWMGD